MDYKDIKKIKANTYYWIKYQPDLLFDKDGYEEHVGHFSNIDRFHKCGEFRVCGNKDKQFSIVYLLFFKYIIEIEEIPKDKLQEELIIQRL